MSYIDGFVIPVRSQQKDAYFTMAKQMVPVFHRLGATRIVECWSDDVPDGKVTDFRRAVQAEPGEELVFSWVEWPSKAVRDAGNARLMEEMKHLEPQLMPFDGRRMIFGGFRNLLDNGVTPDAGDEA